MSSKPSLKLRDLWVQLWASPQATAWESLGWTRMVARYAQVLLISERVNAPAALLGEVRQMEDRLGLSPMAMRRLQWEVAPIDSAAGAPADVTHLADYRDL